MYLFLSGEQTFGQLPPLIIHLCEFVKVWNFWVGVWNLEKMEKTGKKKSKLFKDWSINHENVTCMYV